MSNLLPVVLIILTALWCNLLSHITEPGEIGEKVGKAVAKLPTLLAKLLLTCINCMAWIHSALVMLLFGWARNCLSLDYMKQYFLVAVGAAFLNGIFYLLRKNMEFKFFENNKEEIVEEVLAPIEEPVEENPEPIVQFVKARNYPPEIGETLYLKIGDKRDYGAMYKAEPDGDMYFAGLNGHYNFEDVEYLYEVKKT